MSTGFLWVNLIPDFLGPWAENFSEFRETFCGLLSKCNQCLQGNFWKIRWNLRKILAVLAYIRSLSVNYAFYGSRGTFLGRKCLNNFLFSKFFWCKELFRFLVRFFFGRVAKHAIYVTGDVFSWKVFLRKLVVCILNFRVWAEYCWILVRVLASLSKLHSACV